MTAVIVDNRYDEAMRFVIKQTLLCIPNTWVVRWYHTKDTVIEHVLSQLTTHDRERITCVPLSEKRLNVAAYNRLCHSIAFWESIPTEDILIFQRDGVPCHLRLHTLDYFLSQGYDYIGAAWPKKVQGSFVGNGGISLRKKGAMIRAIEKRPTLALEASFPEDVFFSGVSQDVVSVAPRELAYKFSVETEFGYPIPFACHQYRHALTRRFIPEIEYLHKIS